MKRIIFFALVAMGLALRPASALLAQAVVTTTVDEFEWPESITICDGVVVDFQSRYVFNIRSVTNKSRRHFVIDQTIYYDGVDADGNTYVGTGIFQIVVNQPLKNGAATTHGGGKIKIVSQGPTPLYTLDVSIAITVNANGEMTVFRESSSASCD